MLNESEIRKGVFLKWRDNGQLFDVTIGMMLQGSFWTHISNGDIVEIPLTPELLIDCGFEVTSKGFYTHPNWYNLSLKYQKGTYSVRCNFMDIVATNINHVHSLQNIFYCLCGVELVVDLKG